jgi:hypothetical protein
VLRIITGLLRSSRPIMLMTALVGVVGIGGTAYAGKHIAGGDRKDGSGATVDPSNHVRSAHQSHNSHHGHKGASAAEYGVATVNVSRGGNPASAWATYSTRLGSPVGDTTGGVFRFTCSTANAPCTVAVNAAVLSSSHGAADFYPRVLIYRQDYNSGGPEIYCEYGDGSTGAAPLSIAKQASSATPTYTAVPVNIGGSDDCGLAGPAGDVNQITVPSGYYDVHSTFVFLD